MNNGPPTVTSSCDYHQLHHPIEGAHVCRLDTLMHVSADEICIDTCTRTVRMLSGVMPIDQCVCEEVGGYLGMREFIHTDHFKNMNLGFSMDEGSSSLDDGYYVYYAERTAWRKSQSTNDLEQ